HPLLRRRPLHHRVRVRGNGRRRGLGSARADPTGSGRAQPGGLKTAPPARGGRRARVLVEVQSPGGSSMAANDRVAVVTGAGSGIGRATAIALARDGYSVVAAGRRREPVEGTAEEARALGGQAIAIPTDVGDPSSVKALFAATADAFGRLDLLFNNAGQGAPPVPLEDLTYEQWRAVGDTNLTRA